MEKGYILTKFGRVHGYLDLIPESEVDDALRGTFTILREEDAPITTEYISGFLRFPESYVKRALNKLINAELVAEVE